MRTSTSAMTTSATRASETALGAPRRISTSAPGAALLKIERSLTACANALMDSSISPFLCPSSCKRRSQCIVRNALVSANLVTKTLTIASLAIIPISEL